MSAAAGATADTQRAPPALVEHRVDTRPVQPGVVPARLGDAGHRAPGPAPGAGRRWRAAHRAHRGDRGVRRHGRPRQPRPRRAAPVGPSRCSVRPATPTSTWSMACTTASTWSRRPRASPRRCSSGPAVPVAGAADMRRARHDPHVPDARLLAGPALAVRRSRHRPRRSTGTTSPRASRSGSGPMPPAATRRSTAIVRGPRIGVDYAGPGWADRPWRFGLAGHPALSRPFPTPVRAGQSPA